MGKATDNKPSQQDDDDGGMDTQPEMRRYSYDAPAYKLPSAAPAPAPSAPGPPAPTAPAEGDSPSHDD